MRNYYIKNYIYLVSYVNDNSVHWCETLLTKNNVKYSNKITSGCVT